MTSAFTTLIIIMALVGSPVSREQVLWVSPDPVQVISDIAFEITSSQAVITLSRGKNSRAAIKQLDLNQHPAALRASLDIPGAWPRILGDEFQTRKLLVANENSVMAADMSSSAILATWRVPWNGLWRFKKFNEETVYALSLKDKANSAFLSVLNTSTGAWSAPITIQNDPQAFAIAPRRKMMAFASEGRLQICDLGTSNSMESRQDLPIDSIPYEAEFSPDENWLVLRTLDYGSGGSQLIGFRVSTTTTEAFRFAFSETALGYLRFSKDSRLLAASDGQRTIHICDINDAPAAKPLSLNFTTRVTSCCFVPGNRALAVGFGSFRIYNLNEQERPKEASAR